MAGHGISRSGADAEAEFRRLTGATASERASLGDAVLEGEHIEVKRASSTTLNQVRAVKYIPLAAYFEVDGCWYVVPAHEIVRHCAKKARGQHTENPFESATLSINNLSAFAVPDPGRLRKAVLLAIAEAEKYPELRALMERVLVDSKELASTSISAVRDALVERGLEEPR